MLLNPYRFQASPLEFFYPFLLTGPKIRILIGFTACQCSDIPATRCTDLKQKVPTISPTTLKKI